MKFSVQYINKAAKVVNASCFDVPVIADACDKAYDRAEELNKRFGNSVESFKVFCPGLSITLLAK